MQFNCRKLERERRRQSEGEPEDLRPNLRTQGGNRPPRLAFIIATIRKAIESATEPEAAKLRRALEVSGSSLLTRLEVYSAIQPARQCAAEEMQIKSLDAVVPVF